MLILFILWSGEPRCSCAFRESEKNKVEIIMSRWKLCHASSHSICTSKKQKPKWFPKWIPRSILGQSCKIWTCSLFHCTFHTGNAFIFQHTLVTYSYQSVITFGGCRDDFMVVTSQQREPGVGKKSVEKLVFAMAKPKVSVRSASAQTFSLLDFQVSALPPHVRLSPVILLDDLKQDFQPGIPEIKFIGPKTVFQNQKVVWNYQGVRVNIVE